METPKKHEEQLEHKWLSRRSRAGQNIVVPFGVEIGRVVALRIWNSIISIGGADTAAENLTVCTAIPACRSLRGRADRGERAWPVGRSG